MFYLRDRITSGQPWVYLWHYKWSSLHLLGPLDQMMLFLASPSQRVCEWGWEERSKCINVYELQQINWLIKKKKNVVASVYTAATNNLMMSAE